MLSQLAPSADRQRHQCNGLETTVAAADLFAKAAG
jgi:hypothetical protein